MKPKYLYLVSTKNGCGYDEYDSAVVCARTPAEALKRGKDEYRSGPPFVTATKLGTASSRTKLGGVLGSFNAG